MTATERIYGQWLHAKIASDKARYEGELAAICIAACRKRQVAPPRERREDSGGHFWAGGFKALSPWVYGWVSKELSREVPLKDGARYIARRCVFALIDDIRSDQRRKRGAQVRGRPQIDAEDEARMRSGMREVLANAGLPEGLPVPGDRVLMGRLMAAYPSKLSNVSIAREDHVSEGAIRKRRKRIAALCFHLAEGNYQLRSVLNTLGLKAKGTKNRP